MLKLRAALLALSEADRKKILASLSPEACRALAYDWRILARESQLAPDGDWTTWLIQAGRGFGKTRSGAEWTREIAESAYTERIALVGATAGDVRDTMVEGESGILAVSPPWFRPLYEPSKRRLTWPNGVLATCFTADEPERLRGPQHGAAWADEVGAWRYRDAWDQLRFGLRLGKLPRAVVTTTPRPTPLMREIIGDKSTVITRGSTYDNRANLAPAFFQQIIAKYEGTRLGLQELEAHMLDDTPGALWKLAMIEDHRVREVPELERVVVAIDPAVTAEDDSDETGIVVAGVARVGRVLHGYVLGDLSDRLSPDGWAKKAVGAYQQHQADRIVAEKNNGGDMVELTIRTCDPNRKVAYRGVHASRGKISRAEPVAALYEQGRIHHVGAFGKLESQMTTYVPGVSTKSPDRMDALVWAITELMLGKPADYGTLRVGGAGERESPNRID